MLQRGTLVLMTLLEHQYDQSTNINTFLSHSSMSFQTSKSMCMHWFWKMMAQLLLLLLPVLDQHQQMPVFQCMILWQQQPWYVYYSSSGYSTRVRVFSLVYLTSLSLIERSVLSNPILCVCICVHHIYTGYILNDSFFIMW